MFHIDAEFVERQKDEGYDLWTISQWQHWLVQVPKMHGAVGQIRNAFRSVQLGDGIGLYEANGMDDYAGEVELTRLRELDEKLHWEHLDAKLLTQYYSAPSFFDPLGFVFHLPAFLIAELEDNHEFAFIDRLVEKRPATGSWINLLTPRQADSLVNVLSLVKQHPFYFHDAKKFDHAIKRFARIASTA